MFNGHTIVSLKLTDLIYLFPVKEVQHVNLF